MSEEKASSWHDSKVGTAYTRCVMNQNYQDCPDLFQTRFLIVVLGTYKQMRNQNVAIMSDIDEDNFDRAFDILRPGRFDEFISGIGKFTSCPVITGSADVSKTLTQDELEVCLFLTRILSPTHDLV